VTTLTDAGRGWTGQGLHARRACTNVGLVNLHDWIDELCDVLDLETEVDEGLVLGYAAGVHGAGPSKIEALAARAQALADEWDRPAGAPDPDDVDDDVPDDSGVDHTGDSYDA
jgi:hypothetical protein